MQKNCARKKLFPNNYKKQINKNMKEIQLKHFYAISSFSLLSSIDSEQYFNDSFITRFIRNKNKSKVNVLLRVLSILSMNT